MTCDNIVDTKWCQITKYGISVQILSLQGWNFAGLQQEQTTFLEGENSDFIFWMERAWSPLCCHGNVTVEISRNFVLIATTVQSFSSIQKSLQRYNFHFLWFYIIIFLSTKWRHKSSWITRQPRVLDHSEMDAIFRHFGGSFEWANKKFCVIYASSSVLPSYQHNRWKSFLNWWSNNDWRDHCLIIIIIMSFQWMIWNRCLPLHFSPLHTHSFALTLSWIQGFGETSVHKSFSLTSWIFSNFQSF